MMKYDLLFSSYPFVNFDDITLSRVTEMDLGALWEIMSDEENYRLSPQTAARTKAEVSAKIAQIESQFRERKSIFLGIFSNDSLNKLIGTLEVYDINPQIESATISFTLGHSYNGRGYANAAVNGITKYLIEIIKINRIQTYALPNNYECERLLERCGFLKEGTMRSAFYLKDTGVFDLDLFSMLPKDYAKRW